MTILSGYDLDRVYSVAELAVDAPAAGTVAWDTLGKAYKFVIYDEGTATLDLAVGDVVYYVDDSGYGAATVTADASDSTGQEIGAGVSMGVVDTTATGFWIQIKGFATVAVALGGSAGDGDPLTCVGAADKALIRAIEVDSTGPYKAVVAIAVDATAKEIICDFPF